MVHWAWSTYLDEANDKHLKGYAQNLNENVVSIGGFNGGQNEISSGIKTEHSEDEDGSTGAANHEEDINFQLIAGTPAQARGQLETRSSY